jgi:hypothetical protein
VRSYWLMLAAVVLTWTQETRGEDIAALAPLPEGNTGIAAKYPGDAGIAKDLAVVMTDRFEENTDQWDVQYGEFRIIHEPEHVHSGTGALELMKMPGTSNRGLIRHFTPGYDLLFLRCYTKIGKDADLLNGHNGPAILAKSPDTPDAASGIPADGANQFTARLDCWRPDYQTPLPGYLVFYSYHLDQGCRWGDHIFPSGRISPVERPTESTFGKSFVPRPDIIPERDRWYCTEIMLKANTPGKRDGRIAFWVDGKLAGDFPNLRMRDVESLKANQINLGLYTPSRGGEPPCVLWQDDLVVATSYIGPMVDAKKTPATP